jgi:hypothetical protein
VAVVLGVPGRHHHLLSYISGTPITIGRSFRTTSNAQPEGETFEASVTSKTNTFLWYKISAEGIAGDPEKTRTVLEMPEPENVKDLRCYLGCYGYYRKFISNLSQIAEPLYSLLRKGVKFAWTSRQQWAFDTLKMKLTSAPVLALPVDDAQVIVDSDASDSGVGAVLSMMVKNHLRKKNQLRTLLGHIASKKSTIASRGEKCSG